MTKKATVVEVATSITYKLLVDNYEEMSITVHEDNDTACLYLNGFDSVTLTKEKALLLRILLKHAYALGDD